jgi:Domain of unknown function (DUF4129)
MAFFSAMRVGVLLALVLGTASGVAEGPPADGVSDAGVRAVSLEEYRAHLGELRGLVAACRADAGACDPAKVGAGNRVAAVGKDAAFEVHWGWLWDVVMKAKDAKLAERGKLLDTAEARLEEQSREAGVVVGTGSDSAAGVKAAASTVPFERARADADGVLARAEFKHVTKNSFWDELLGRFFAWMSRMFGGVSTLGRKNPWLGPLVEVGFVTLALAGLLVWVRRVMARQRLAIKMESPAAMAQWKETSRSWATLAEAAAADGEWREAVHSLYWASVTELEGQRVWRQNNARTPREYLRLVAKDAPQYGPLRVLTQLLERIWYGLAPAAKSDYEKALAVYDELRSA